MMETLQQLDAVVYAGAGVIIALIAAGSYLYTQRDFDTPDTERLSNRANSFSGRFEEIKYRLQQKGLELALGIIGAVGLFGVFGVDTPLPAETQLTVMYTSIGLIAAALVIPRLHDRLYTPDYDYLSESNPKENIKGTWELDSPQLEQLLVVEPIFTKSETTGKKYDVTFKRRNYGDLNEVYLKTSSGIKRAYECYRFYPERLIAITSRRSELSGDELKEYEDALENLKLYDRQARHDYRKLRSTYEDKVDEESLERFNEFLHLLSGVAYNEDREFSERVRDNMSEDVEAILDQSMNERLDIDDSAEKHRKGDVLDELEKSDESIENLIEGDSDE